MMRFCHALRVLGLLVVAGVGLAAGPETRPQAAEISGTIKTAQKMVRVVAIDRGFADVLKTSKKECRDKFVYEGPVDGKTGAFRVPRLLAGRTYDLVVWTEGADGVKVRWEGACMDYHREIVADKQGATAEDKKWLEDFIKDMPSFYDKARVLHMAADHKHATLLVELARTRDFHSGKGGEVIYRIELWYFENLFGGWAKDKNTEKVLARWRGPGAQIEKNWQFLPELGGIVPGGKPVNLSLPKEVTGQNGLAGKGP
jgi:hypothetical protein